MNYLLDTNVISEFSRSSPHANVVNWVQTHQDDFHYLSVITLGEIQRGIALLPDSKKRQQLNAWFHDILDVYAEWIMPIDHAIMLQWGTITADLSRGGLKIPIMDALIAATCLHFDLILVTRNVSDYAPTGLQLINPWD